MWNANMRCQASPYPPRLQLVLLINHVILIFPNCSPNLQFLWTFHRGQKDPTHINKYTTIITSINHIIHGCMHLPYSYSSLCLSPLTLIIYISIPPSIVYPEFRKFLLCSSIFFPSLSPLKFEDNSRFFQPICY